MKYEVCNSWRLQSEGLTYVIEERSAEITARLGTIVRKFERVYQNNTRNEVEKALEKLEA